MMSPVTVVAWNIAHQIYERSIPTELGVALEGIGSDVIFLTEFVDGASRQSFRDQLFDAGYIHQAVTSAPARHNHVFAASRIPFRRGDIQPPVVTAVDDQFAQSNFLHICLLDSELELIGVRAPLWRSSAVNRAYRGALASVLSNAAGARALVVAGDINQDPFTSVHNESVTNVPFPDASGYSVVRPDGDWSFTNHDGSRRTRIDHVLHTPRARVSDARYVHNVGGIQLAGPKPEQPLSDHAALAFTAAVTNGAKACANLAP